MERARRKLEERLRAMFDDFLRGEVPLGCCGSRWTRRGAAKTHGASACDAMLEKVQRALANGLRPAEEMGRWGDDEFLVICRTSARGDAGSACADAGRPGAHGGFSLVGRPGFAHGEHRRGAGRRRGRKRWRDLLERAQAGDGSEQPRGRQSTLRATRHGGDQTCSPS